MDEDGDKSFLFDFTFTWQFPKIVKKSKNIEACHYGRNMSNGNKSGTGDITPVPFDGVIKESFRPDDYPDMPGRSWPVLFRFLFLHPVWREGQ